MKATGIIFLVLLIIAVVFAVAVFGFGLFIRSDMNVVFVECIATDPVSQQDYFSALKDQLETDTFVGTRFMNIPLSAPDQYIFYSYVINLENNTQFTASAVGITVSEVVQTNSAYRKNHDILQIGDTNEYIVPPHSSVPVTVTILASRDVLNEDIPSYRKAVVTWYYEGVSSPPGSFSQKEIKMQ